MLNILKRFYNRNDTHLFAYQGTNTPYWSAPKYENWARDGFKRNVFVFRAINLIAQGISSIPVQLEGEDSDLLSTILSTPNDLQGQNSFIETIIYYLLISGNSFIRLGEDNSLCCLRSDRVKLLPNSDNTAVASYCYNVASIKISIPADDILHLKLFNPLDDWYGHSPLESAMQAVDQYSEMARHNLAILQNGGRPSGCFILKQSNLTDEQRAQLRDDITANYSGTRRAGKILILEGGLEWKEMGLSPKDMDFESGKNITAREIAQAFGVPPVLLGIQGDSAFTSYKEARLHFWEDTVLPLAERIWSDIIHWLTRRLQLSVSIRLNIDAIPALSVRRDRVWNRISNAQFLTINEKRKILGFPPLENEDVIQEPNKKEVDTK